MPLAFVALGANLADPVRQVQAALDSLAHLPDCHLLCASSLYRTAPIDAAGQPDFINAVALVETTLSPRALLAALFDIEAQFDRRRDFRNAPRTLDLDLLLYDDLVLDSADLQLPHPRMHLRAFVLEPLLEISPACTIPGRGSAVAWRPAVSMQAIDKLVA